MGGNGGQLAIRLPYPVVIEAVSIDHVSRVIAPEGWHKSAPKKLKIWGYPPCYDDGEECALLGFESTKAIPIGTFYFDIKGPSVQTFESYFGMAMSKLAAEANEKEEEKGFGLEVDSGSCSEEKASCSAPPRIGVATVIVEVLENWGEEDFTCLYRLRVHGEPDV
jgi:SUN domain-containing protein 1/2